MACGGSGGTGTSRSITAHLRVVCGAAAAVIESLDMLVRVLVSMDRVEPSELPGQPESGLCPQTVQFRGRLLVRGWSGWDKDVGPPAEGPTSVRWAASASTLAEDLGASAPDQPTDVVHDRNLLS